MKRILWITFWLAAIFFPAAVYADSVLSVQGPASVTRGDAFSLAVNISNVTDLYAFQLDLTFDPTLLQAQGVTEGSFLAGAGDTFFLPGTLDNTTGSIAFNANTLLSATPGANGSGTLLFFDFVALNTGTSSLDLADALLLDSLGNTLTFTTQNGVVLVNASGTGPVISPEPSTFLCISLGGLSLLLLKLARKP